MELETAVDDPILDLRGEVIGFGGIDLGKTPVWALIDATVDVCPGRIEFNSGLG